MIRFKEKPEGRGRYLVRIIGQEPTGVDKDFIERRTDFILDLVEYIWVRDILIGTLHVFAVSGSTLHPIPPNKVILTLSAPTVVDESAIKEAFARYEAEWPAVQIRWPQSADDLVRVLREGLELLDKGGGAIEGAHVRDRARATPSHS